MDIVMKRDERTGQERPHERDLQDRPRVVRVMPKNDAVRRYLKHGMTKVGFLAEGSAEWPLDQFTKRRIKDGDVTVEEAPALTDQSEGADTTGTQTPIQSTGAKSPAGTADKSPPPGDTSGAVNPSKTTAPAPGTPGSTAP